MRKIKFFDLTEQRAQNRVSYYQSVRLASEEKFTEYFPDAHIPAGSISTCDCESEFNTGGLWRQGSSVAVVSVNKALCSEALCALTRIRAQKSHRTELEIVTNELVSNIFKSNIFSGDVHAIGYVSTNDPLPTLTKNFGSSERVGLHVDDWTSEPIMHRGDSPNRLVINLGPDERFFLFVGVSIVYIAKIYKRIYSTSCENSSDLCNWYLRNKKNIKVYAVKILPGEAYIAPTENCIHDAFTPNGLANTTFMLRSNISPKLFDNAKAG